MGTALSSALIGRRPRPPQLMQSQPLQKIAARQSISRPPPALASPQQPMMLQSHYQQVNVPTSSSNVSARSTALPARPKLAPNAATDPILHHNHSCLLLLLVDLYVRLVAHQHQLLKCLS